MCGLTNSEIGGGSGDNERLSETEAVYEQRYQELSKDLRELVARYERSHNGALDHLLKYFVSPHLPTTTQEVRELSLLIDTSQDERPIQSYLESHPHILTRKLQPGHHGQFCIPKPRLGSDLIPDFLVAEVDSAGIWWFGVELESPQERMFKRDGDPTSTLSHALRQVEDWRHWLSSNITYARDQLLLTDVVADLPCIVLIGTREKEVLQPALLARRQGDVRRRDKAGLILHHYEWLLEV